MLKLLVATIPRYLYVLAILISGSGPGVHIGTNEFHNQIETEIGITQPKFIDIIYCFNLLTKVARSARWYV